MLTAGVIGLGVVGGALFEGLKLRGINVFGFDKDPKRSRHTLDEVLAQPVIFVSVNTPTVRGVQDLSALHSICLTLKSAGYSGVVVIKSTVVPKTCEKLALHYGLRIVHNPEFLREVSPLEDFLRQPVVLIGGAFDDRTPVFEIYDTAGFATMQFSETSITELAKYIHNLFLSTKVGFFNEIYEYCQKTGIDFDLSRDAAVAVGQIGANHTRVPGPDGKLGFGGMCFPKDTGAFLGHMFFDLGLASEVLRGVVSANVRRRGPNA